MEAKKYIIIKNHVREMPSVDYKISSTSARSRKDSRENKYSSFSCNCELKNRNSHIDIDKSDIKDLQIVYKKCKKIIKKIESKYGHLLNDEEHDCCRKRKRLSSQNGDICNCVSNSKVFFDEDGLQVGHKLNDAFVSSTSSVNGQNIQISQPNKELSDNLLSLKNILQDPVIETKYRNEVINKYRYIQEELRSDLNLEKPSLVNARQKDSDEIFKFVGSNLSTLTGYPT